MDNTTFLAPFASYLALLVEADCNEQNRIQRLTRTVDALIIHETAIESIRFDDNSDVSADVFSSTHFIETVFRLFPSLGMYNVPLSVTSDIGVTKLGVMHAHDDIASIASEVSQITWYTEHVGLESGLWWFRFSMENELGHHLHNLRWYLFARRYEA